MNRGGRHLLKRDHCLNWMSVYHGQGRFTF
jgi:hypothetical protein